MTLKIMSLLSLIIAQKISAIISLTTAATGLPHDLPDDDLVAAATYQASTTPRERGQGGVTRWL
jgi:hypothetical protein